MCVDKHHFTCCCGCTLTCGTITIGVIMTLGAISYAATQEWVSFVFAGVLGATCLSVLCNQHSADTRKIIYYVYLVFAIGQSIAYVILIITLYSSYGVAG